MSRRKKPNHSVMRHMYIYKSSPTSRIYGQCVDNLCIVNICCYFLINYNYNKGWWVGQKRTDGDGDRGDRNDSKTPVSLEFEGPNRNGSQSSEL